MKKLRKQDAEIIIGILYGVMNQGYMSEGATNKYSDLIDRLQSLTK